MLLSLFVKNFALIEELHFQPETGLNVITGETGAGKSIILGALGLVLGNRAETAALYNLTEKCIVEAVFSSENMEVEAFFKMKELDLDREIILRREIAVSGKSRAFINDTPVTLTDLKELGSLLMEIHTQNTNLLIRDNNEQLLLVDDFGTPKELLYHHRELWNNYVGSKTKLQELEIQIERALAEREFLRFQLDELDAFLPVENEDSILEEKANLLAHAADITESGNLAIDLLTEHENSVYSQLQQVRNALKGVAGFHPQLSEIYARLENSMEEIRELSRDLQKPSQSTEYNPTELDAIQNRIATLQMLLRKHHAENSTELIALQNNFRERLNIADHAEEEIKKIKNAVEENYKECLKSAKNLHQIRVKLAEELCAKAIKDLSKLGMPKAKLVAKTEFQNEFLNVNGATKVQLLFNANGSKELPLEKVASGGEVSRLNFCFKSILAGKKSLGTIIFDETDTGVSGEIALRFGEMMADLGKYHQIIAITHLPQVAAKGKTHFEVYKTEKGDASHTHIRKLNEAEKIGNIATMLSGHDPGEAALAAAKELLGI